MSSPAMDLWQASHAGSIERVRELLCQGADPNEKKQGQTPLICAAEKGHSELCQLLLDNGAYIDEVDTYRMSALHWAVRKQHLQTSELLLRRGARPSDPSLLFSETPQDLARLKGNVELIRLLCFRKPQSPQPPPAADGLPGLQPPAASPTGAQGGGMLTPERGGAPTPFNSPAVIPSQGDPDLSTINATGTAMAEDISAALGAIAAEQGGDPAKPPQPPAQRRVPPPPQRGGDDGRGEAARVA
eukprot:TRINITY_DN50962_c0_g1_i1.p1 TRINITY_DN50962_c0_g1~~TRINITY_DN50962_c0_g1_i1.p1  ORF type:complete len:273 (+),score=77.93 TRINITY_DN50962_c0_g1_i1:89-820(+)